MLKKITLLTVILFAVFVSSVWSQNVKHNGVIVDDLNEKTTTVTGIVKDEQGEPLTSVSVVLKGTTIGSMTDLDGRFSISAPSTKATLVVSYVGYQKQEIVLNGKAEFNIILKEDAQMLSGVVVVGYGTMDKKELTSAVSHISSKDFLNIGGVDPAMQIQGKVAGVSISNTESGNPNSGANIQVRGISSRSAGLGPLIVVDGIPGGNLHNINSNDIESIDILKDGAASAIYGTRGSNGVILVTTKRGTGDGKVRTEYSGYVSIDIAHKDLDILSADEFRKYKVDSKMATDFGDNVDWMDEITRTGFSQNHALTLSGGSQKSNYRLSVDVRDAKGIDIRSDRFDYGARLGFDHTTNSGLIKFSGNLTPRIIKRNNSNTDAFKQALNANPTMPVKNKDDVTGKSYTQFTGDGMWNPVDKLKNERDYNEHKNLEWNLSAKVNLLPLLAKDGYSEHGLNTSFTVSQQFNDDHYYKFLPTYSTLTESYDLGKLAGYGEAKQDYKKHREEMFEWLVNYSFEKNDHYLGVMGGYSYQQFMDYGFSAENKRFTSNSLTWDNLGDGAYMKEEGRNGMGSFRNSSKLISFFGRVTYDYKKRYLMTASLRYEGSSKFGINNKWGYFPAVSAGWRMSDEVFMKDIEWIDDLKLRGDLGVTGNQAFDSYISLATYGGFGDVYYNGEYYKGWGANKNTNPDLKWEKGVNFNIGLDFSLFGRLTGSLNYYNRKQQDLLGNYNVSVPPYLWNQMFVNVGTMRNTGFEIDLNVQAVKTNDFTYNVGFVGATQNNNFLNFSDQTFKGQDDYPVAWMEAPGSPGNIQRISKGERVGTFYTYRYAGVDDGGNWLVYNKDNEVIPISEAKEHDKAVTGNGLPKFTASLNNTFTYKNFDLSLYFRGAFGYDIFNVHDFYYGLQNVYGPYNVQKKAFTDNAHITKGQNLLTDYFMEKGDYVKLDVVTLGYTLSLKNKWLESIRLYGTVKNVFTITGFSGIDPAQYPVNGLTPSTFNGNKTYYPSTTQFLFGAQISF